MKYTIKSQIFFSVDKLPHVTYNVIIKYSWCSSEERCFNTFKEAVAFVRMHQDNHNIILWESD